MTRKRKNPLENVNPEATAATIEKLTARPGKGLFELRITLDYPSDACTLEQASEDFTRLADKWVGENGTRILASSLPLAHTPPKL